MSTAEALRTVCAIQQTPGFAPSSTALALAVGRELGTSLDGLRTATDADLVRMFGWSGIQLRAFHAHLTAPLGRFERFVARGIRVSTRLDSDLPGWCDRLPSTPWFYYLGDIAVLDTPSIGFSGSRDAGEEALRITRTVASESVAHGMTVISGGARGVDMAAHTVALDAGGCTVVLVPQGLDTWNPPYPLVDSRVDDRVLVLSEDLPWAGWTTPSAMQRNRAIVDLSELIVIPQAGTGGGSASTGKYALGRKRDLWVADLGDEAPGNQALLRRGASPLPWIEDVPDIALMRAPTAVTPAQQSLF